MHNAETLFNDIHLLLFSKDIGKVFKGVFDQLFIKA